MNRRSLLATLSAGLLALLGLRPRRVLGSVNAKRPQSEAQPPATRTYMLWQMMDGSTLQVEGPQRPAGASYLFATFTCSDISGQTVVMSIQQGAAFRS